MKWVNLATFFWCLFELSAQIGGRVRRARRALILASYGACKHFHSDLLQRALILLVALTGNQGKRGGGLRVAAWWSLSGFETLAAGYEPPFLAEQLLRLYRPRARTMEFFLSKHMRENYLMTPTLLWLYVHGGLAKTHAEIEPDLKEAPRRAWMPVYPKPGKGSEGSDLHRRQSDVTLARAASHRGAAVAQAGSCRVDRLPDEHDLFEVRPRASRCRLLREARGEVRAELPAVRGGGGEGGRALGRSQERVGDLRPAGPPRSGTSRGGGRSTRSGSSRAGARPPRPVPVLVQRWGVSGRERGEGARLQRR